MMKTSFFKNDKLIIALGLATVSVINLVDIIYVFRSVQTPAFQILHITAVTSFLAAAFFIFRYAFKQIREKKLIEKKVGKFNNKLVFNSGRKTDVLTNPVKHLEGNLKNTIDFIREIGKGNYEVRFEELDDSNIELNKKTLIGELLNMRKQMKDVAQEEQQRSWANQGIAKFSDLLRSYNSNFEELGDEVVREMVKYIGANQGGLYVVREENDDKHLELLSCYAYERKKYINQKIHYKEGLVGQCYLEGETIFLTDVPANYVTITSGLGKATPTCVVLLPLKLNDEVEGVLELASFDVFETYQMQFLEKLAESIASTIRNIKISENTQNLLQESQVQTEQLRSQEEEMRQNMEELSATQEELERKSRESQAQFTKLNAILDSTNDAIITISSSGLIEGANKATKTLFGYNINALTDQKAQILLPDVQITAYGITSESNIGQANSRVFKTTGRKKGGDEITVELSFNEVDVDGKKLYTTILRDLSEREEHEKEQQQMIEEMRATEEELRQNMEELSATQEEVERQLRESNKFRLELEARESVFSVSTILSEANIYGTITHVNDKLCEVSMYSREELIGKPHNVFRHPEMPKEAFKIMWETIKSGNVFRGIVKNLRKDGGHYWVDAVIAPVFDENGKIVKYIGARYHITDDELAENLFAEFLQKLGLDKLEKVV